MVGGASSSGNKAQYNKFSTEMDVLMLEIIQNNNPFTARHGSRITMWQNVAEKLGKELNAKDLSWHTCRDRMDALLKLFDKEELDRLYKKCDEPELNQRKEELLTLIASLRRLPKSENRKRSHNEYEEDHFSRKQSSEIFRARVLELLETKMKTDAEFRTKQLLLREEELKLQQQFLTVLKGNEMN